MRILVTGGAGFIGSHLAEALLEEGHEVSIVDDLSSGREENIPSEAKFFRADLAQRNSIQMFPQYCDVIFHAAAHIDLRHSVEDPYFDASANILGTINLLEYARLAGTKKIVFSSTGGAIYGETDKLPTAESVEPNPEAPYGISKLSAEKYMELYHRLHDFLCVNLRYANVYGPRQSGSKESGVIAIFSERLQKDEPLIVYGDGQQTRDFVFVDDVVRANLAALEKNVVGTFNIGTETQTSINELIVLLKEAGGKVPEVRYEQARGGEVWKSCLAVKKAKKVLGWVPQIALKEGLEKTLRA